MDRRRGALGLCLVFACHDPDVPKAPSGPPAVAPSTGGWGSAGDLAKVPGEIWYVAVDRSGALPPKLMRIARGKREAIAEAIVPYARMPTDERVVGVRTHQGKQQLVLISHGDELQIVPFGPTADAVRDVEPVGLGVAMVATVVDGGASSVVRVNVQDQHVVKLAEGREPTPLRSGIAFVARGDIFTTEVAIEREAPRELVHTPATESAPRSNRDGTALLFGSDREGPTRLFLLRDGVVHRVTDRTEARDEHSHVWSPDGRLIAYVVQRGPRRHVWIRDLEAHSEIDVTPEGILDGEPVFSPDSRWIVVSRTRGHDVDLWAIPAGVGEPVRLTTERFADVHPRWF